MKNIVAFLSILFILSLSLTNCKSNKVSCPAYGGNEKPGGIPKSTKRSSGVMPGDGHGSRTKLPK